MSYKYYLRSTFCAVDRTRLRKPTTAQTQTLPAIAKMRQLLTTLTFILGLISCQEKVSEIDSRTTEIENYFKDLKKTKETKFGGGDVWGTTYIFNNSDSSITKVIVSYDAGDYGNGKNEYLIVDNRLIYQRDSILDEIINKSPLDSNNYKLRETISYFNKDSTGTRTSKSVYLMTIESSDEKKNELMNKTADSVALVKTDYIKAFRELKEALDLKLIKE